MVAVGTAIVATFALGVALAGFFFMKIPWFNRLFIGLGAIALFISVTSELMPLGFVLKIVGLVFIAPLLLSEWRRRRLFG